MCIHCTGSHNAILIRSDCFTYPMTKTMPVRVTMDVYERAIKVRDTERQRGSPMARALTRTDTNWFTELVDRGVTAYLHDTKQDRGEP